MLIMDRGLDPNNHPSATLYDLSVSIPHNNYRYIVGVFSSVYDPGPMSGGEWMWLSINTFETPTRYSLKIEF